MASVYRYRRGPLVLRWIKKSGTVAIEVGDLLKHNTTATESVTPVSASGEASALVGVAMQASPATDNSGTKVKFAEIGHGTVFEFPAAASDNHGFGIRFKITAAQELTVISTWTNCVAVCSETKDASSTNTLVSFLPGAYLRSISASG